MSQLIGLSKSKARIANKFGVNVYSSNKVLEEELDRLGRADFIGGLSASFAKSFVPGAGALLLSASGASSALNEQINATDPSELWVQNKERLLGMQFDEETVKRFLNNPVFAPDRQTIFTIALKALEGVDNLDLFIQMAIKADNADAAQKITQLAVMSSSYHNHVKPLKRFEPLAPITRAVNADGAVVVLLPTDYVIWNQTVADAADSLADSLKSENADVEIWTLGEFSQRAQTELQARGWKIHTDVEGKLTPEESQS